MAKKSAPKKKLAKRVSKPAKKPAPRKKAIKKVAPKKVMKKVTVKKVVQKKIVKATARVAPKASQKPAAQPSQTMKKAAIKPTGANIASKMLVTEGRKSILSKRTVMRKQEYKYDVEEAILAQLSTFKLSGYERAPVALREVEEALTPKMTIGGRVFLTKDDSIEMMRSLIDVQIQSYRWFLTTGLAELLKEVSPITDFSNKKMELNFLGHTFDRPKYDPATCKRRNLSYEAAMKGHVQLINKETGEIKEQDVFLGSIPLMTDNGTFVVGGIERVVVSQLVRSPGVFFSAMPDFPKHHAAKIIPKRGVWMEIETDRRGIITCKIDRKRKIPITQLLRVFGYKEDSAILDLFKDVTKQEKDFVLATLEKDTVRTVDEAYQSIYRKIRPGDLATAENAKSLIDGLFFDFKKYDMGNIARYKLNRRFAFTTPNDEKHRVFQVTDFIEILKELIRLNNGEGTPDDIDHLSNRRVRSVGELVQNKYRVGLMRTERIMKDRMTVMDLETVTPTQLINCRPITAALREFFASSQLSQFMDQTNPLSELAHKRRLSAMGPGGLSRERASFDVRDVHPSHYGRICPIATPEGPNIGLVVHLASYAKVNEYGFLETPYYEVKHAVKMDSDALVGRMVDVVVRDGHKVIAKEGEEITSKQLASKVISLLKTQDMKEVPVRAFILPKEIYIDADRERHLTIAEANSKMNEKWEFLASRVHARKKGEPVLAHVRDVTHSDISPKQILSVSTSLIPFLEHDDNTRASMGTNMQRQAVPLIKPHAPLVGTGMESVAARASGHVLLAQEEGEVLAVDAREIVLLYHSGRKVTHLLDNFARSNQGTCFHMRPRVTTGQKIHAGEVLADGSAVEGGELALGQNLLVAYMSWGGYNFEDAIIISDRVVEQGQFDSIHIESYITDVRDTKLGSETVTRDIPNVGEGKLKDLDTDGIVRIGATVHEGDILVGKITPKGETELTPEERILQAIFGDKAKDVKDSSLRLPGGAGGKVVDVHLFDRGEGDELPTGVIKQIKVFVAQTRKVQVGDKMAGRHGNKGVVARIVAKEDMPFLADGRYVDIILNPLGVSSRMNIGQILETHLGWAAQILGFKIATPALNGISTDTILKFLNLAKLPATGKVQLFDGRSGEAFSNETTVGQVYMLKLLHLVEDKIHARSVGPYSLVTQQPLGGKAQHGGQRFGEMEVWALEAYGAAHTLQEMLTIKSDDVVGRSKAYESIVKGEGIKKPSTPESFNVLVKELQALGLKVDLLKFADEVPAEAPIVQLAEGEAEVIKLKTRFDEEVETEDLIPASDKITDLDLLEDDEDEDAIKKGIEEGEIDPEEGGATAKKEMKEAVEEDDDK